MRWLYALCWAGDDQPGLLMEHAVAWLLAKQVLLPGVSTLERFGARVRERGLCCKPDEGARWSGRITCSP